jgi:hypothetical protein
MCLPPLSVQVGVGCFPFVVLRRRVRQADYAMERGYMVGAGEEDDSLFWGRCFLKVPL